MTTNSALYCIEMGALALVFSLIFPSSEYFKWPGSIDISYTADNSEASQLPRVW